MKTLLRTGSLGMAMLMTALLPSFASGDPDVIDQPGAPTGWQFRAARAEITPSFEVKQTDRGPHLIIRSGEKKGCNGHWSKTFPVTGGKHHAFTAFRKTENVATPRRSVLVRIEWIDDRGKPVPSQEPINPHYSGANTDLARPEFPRDKTTDQAGWTEVSDVYRAPDDATQAVVQLHLRWASGGSVVWRDVSFTETTPPPPRTVKLAAIHASLRGGDSPRDNLDALAPLLAQAGRERADLVVLPECIDTKSTGLSVEEGAASLADCVAFLGEQARKHEMYIVAGLHEREDHLVYNVAVLIGPDGKVAGKYRKCTLPREEIASGVQPGDAYPVFDTRFGKLGMMICYDVFFPEVARQLANHGAEIIAVPVWGANPALASARCIENHVYLVTSTYTDHEKNWMKTAVWDREGRPIAEATAWNTLVSAEVDLNQRTTWRHLGDFQSRIQRERPLWGTDASD